MTSLREFLGDSKRINFEKSELASGSFSCQHEDCDEVINDGTIDRVNNRIHWVCSNGHESSVVI